VSAAAEHALRTLGDELLKAAKALRGGSESAALVNVLGLAHVATADKLQAEREAREAKVERKLGQPVYDPRPKRAGRG
jgi:hypothetical protein